MYHLNVFFLNTIIMDINSFSDDEFDTKAWINEILSNADSQKDSNYTMSLVMKLQLYVQQLNTALEETSQQVLASLPKIMSGTQSLQEEALILKKKMATVRVDIEKIEYDTGKSIDEIEKLDSIMNKLNVAKQGLHESDNWTVLVNDLEEVFDKKNIVTISNKIVGMQNSLQLLVNVADYDDRKLQLEGLKNRLEAIASPAIVQAFNNNDLEQSQQYLKIFASIGRLSQLMKYYAKCHKDMLLKKWRNQVESEHDENFIHSVDNYYSQLLSTWHSSIRWLQQVGTGVDGVPSPQMTLLEVYTDALSSLAPAMTECIQISLKGLHTHTQRIGFLMEVKEVAKKFMDSISKIIHGEHSQEKNVVLNITKLWKAIFGYLVPHISKYATYEEEAMIEQLNKLHLKKDCQECSMGELMSILQMSVRSVFEIAEEARGRCQHLTEGCGYPHLLTALRGFFKEYAQYYKWVLKQIQAKHDEKNNQEEDWNTFQICFYLLQNTGEVLLNIQELEKKLTDDILQLNQKKTNVEFKYLLLNEMDLKEYESLLKCVTEGRQLSLLEYSANEFIALCADIHRLTYDVVFAPITAVLNVVHQPATWEHFHDLRNADQLPDYSFTPQEYITQIGQYLMTVPQHLEPFLLKENPPVICALKAADSEYTGSESQGGSLASTFLSILTRGACQRYTDNILSIRELTQAASRQLAHDINYLNNILEELGVPLTESLQHLSVLLNIPSEQYQAKSQECCPLASARLVAAVRQMRNISNKY